jgi:hypothetical protein
LRPFQIAYFDGAKPVPVGHENQCRVTMPVAPLAGGPGKRFDLRRAAAIRDCSVAWEAAVACELTGLGCLAALTVGAQSLTYSPVVYAH